MEELERELLGGMKAQGPETAAEVNFMLRAKNMEDEYPLFTAVHKYVLTIGDIPNVGTVGPYMG